MNYLHTHPNATIRYHPSDIQPHVDSDAAYLVSPKAKSRVGGYFFLSVLLPPSQPPKQPALNAPIHVECHLLKHVVTSAAEAETSAIFHNCKIALNIRKMLLALGHPQSPIPIKFINQELQVLMAIMSFERLDHTLI